VSGIVGHPALWHNIQKQVAVQVSLLFYLRRIDSPPPLGAHTCKKCINPPSKYDAVHISSVVVVCACFLSVMLLLLRKQVAASIFDAPGLKRHREMILSRTREG
jgi:hypothetical protein